MILAGLLMTACSVFDDHMYGPEGEHIARLSFTLALGSSDGPGTKAETWDPDDPVFDGDGIGYDPKMLGDSYDNMIDPSSLQVVFYEDGDNDADGQPGEFLGIVQITGYYPLDVNPDGVTNLYHMEGRLLVDEDIINPEDSYRMMVFANLPDSQRAVILSEVPYTQLEDLCFSSYPSGGKERDASMIPMWGVKTVRMDFRKNDLYDLETVYVLRAVAKIEVKLSDYLQAQGYSLTRLSVSNTNPQGYCIPGGAWDVLSTESLSLDACFRALGSGSFVSPYVENGSGSSSMAIYVPEKDNTSASAEPSTLGLRLNYIDGNGVTTSIEPADQIHFVEYVSGQPTGTAYDIRRNHNYVFEINNILTEVDGLKFLVTIKDLEDGGSYGFVYN
jgi:hypothetical protein